MNQSISRKNYDPKKKLGKRKMLGKQQEEPGVKKVERKWFMSQ